MVNYLNIDETREEMKRGGSVEQWLRHYDNPNYREIRWLRIDKEPNEKFSVTLFSVFDRGSLEFLDIYEFDPVDPDYAFGESKAFETSDEALDFALTIEHCKFNQFVRAGDIQIIYRDFLLQYGKNEAT